MDLTIGAHMPVRGERECESSERHNSEEEAYSEECTKGTRADWAGEGDGGWRRESELVRRIGLTRPNPREDSNKDLFFEFQ
jgi:hypothetical protein